MGVSSYTSRKRTAHHALESEVDRPGQEAPDELPLPYRYRARFGEEIHQGKKQPDCRAGNAQAATARSAGQVPRSATPELIPGCLRQLALHLARHWNEFDTNNDPQIGGALP